MIFLQNTFLLGVKLSDYHYQIKRAVSWLSANINFNAINRHQFFMPDSNGMKNWRQNPASNLWRFISGAGF